MDKDDRETFPRVVPRRLISVVVSGSILPLRPVSLEVVCVGLSEWAPIQAQGKFVLVSNHFGLSERTCPDPSDKIERAQQELDNISCLLRRHMPQPHPRRNPPQVRGEKLTGLIAFSHRLRASGRRLHLGLELETFMQTIQ